ncbi:hypothetical protein JZ751_029432 [Albula glossodonta]|uniref:Uncharacterized protein n=1 Tax=Albula glossodonta TaxID=121402 RepID=A0A8T2PHM6_9TELE|nr:hypothetical protein JZ751_029432 [Albula glossodonta]
MGGVRECFINTVHHLILKSHRHRAQLHCSRAGEEPCAQSSHSGDYAAHCDGAQTRCQRASRRLLLAFVRRAPHGPRGSSALFTAVDTQECLFSPIARPSPLSAAQEIKRDNQGPT